MKEPTIKIGFIVFASGHEQEIRSVGGHNKTAWNWIKEKGLLELYNKVCENPDNHINDPEDFLMSYVGAIKLHAVRGQLKCFIPRTAPNAYKSYLKRYFRERGYVVYGDISADADKNSNSKLEYERIEYGRTVITAIRGNEKILMYNPVKDGD